MCLKIVKFNANNFFHYRIRNEHNGGAWCPKDVIKDGVKEYLEIDFSAEYRVTQTETQGRFGNGRGLEFAEQFQLEYYRDTLGRWVLYKDHFGRNVSSLFTI